MTPLNSIVESLCNSRNLGEAARLIFSYTLEPHLYSVYSKILQLCTDLKSRRSGQLIHSRIVAGGFLMNACLSTRLIIFYSKIGEMEIARKLFDGMSERSVVTWTALISGYSQNGDHEEALKVFSAMHSQGMKANQFTYGSALSACTHLLHLEQGNQIQGCVQKGRFVDNLFVQSALVDFHSKCGKMEDACCVFESMEKRDLVSWNAMIGGYAAQGLSDNAISVFCRMLREGMLPDSFSFGCLLRACVGNEGLPKVKIVHGHIFQFGFRSHKFLSGSFVDAYVKCGSVASANQVYNNIQNKDLVSCTALIKGYACEDTSCTAALQLFNEILRKTAIDGILLCSMFNICAKTASLSLGRQLHAYALKYQNRHDVAVGNALIDMYSKSGVIEDAIRVFKGMEEKNIISWTSLIAGYGKHGYGHEAFALYVKMEAEGLKPNDVTLLSLLFACSHNGLATQGWECFSNMVSKHNILPRAEHYSCLVDLLARAGRLEEAYDLVCNMPTGVDASVLGAILGACSTYGNLILGQRVARHLFNLQPANPANYVVLSGIYAATGLWNGARETRTLMGKQIGSKHPGYSLCQTTST
ncbi:hypothetical protein CDL12_08119 [Handroanthus impetiginosus]|uniref:Pentacotripeptide-repeat region of PRORP domain-containing protein n=1 Tax=Handroanthus impetiginosus TaxID=429701 RepID=A0A2G9HP36_9LAMI|nr:hypothetical protein CDL12_08119 [Handroanthus impetiginosus]